MPREIIERKTNLVKAKGGERWNINETNYEGEVDGKYSQNEEGASKRQD